MKPASGTGRIIAVVPALNEAPRIGRVVRGIFRTGLAREVIVVDDGSGDRTGRAASASGAIVIRHPLRRGVGAALRTGFREAIRRGAGTIVVMGGDDQDNARELRRHLAAIREGYDFVQGSRWIAKGRVVRIPFTRRIMTILYSFLFSVLSGFRVTDGTNGFRAFRTSFLRTVRLDQRWLDAYELEPYLYWHALVDGWSVTEVPVTKRYPKSRKGFTKMVPLVDWWGILRPIVLLATGVRS